MDSVWSLLDHKRREGRRILFEGAQGALLDIDHGTYPYVTSSNTVAAQAATGSGMGPGSIGYVLGICKAYTTRVGSGPFPTELTDATGQLLGDRGKEFGTVTGRRRRCGWLDVVMLRKAVRINSLTELAITKLDVLDTFDEVKVCTSYAADGSPQYAVLPGWKTDLSAVTELADLPQRARDFVALVEREVGVPVRIVGTGAERESYVIWS